MFKNRWFTLMGLGTEGLSQTPSGRENGSWQVEGFGLGVEDSRLGVADFVFYDGEDGVVFEVLVR